MLEKINSNIVLRMYKEFKNYLHEIAYGFQSNGNVSEQKSQK
jgi:hypothetical protein